MRLFVLALFACSLTLAACDSDDSRPGGPIRSLALAEGTQWTYARTFEQYLPRAGGTELDSVVITRVDTVVLAVAERGVTLGDQAGLIEIRGRGRYGPFSQWYRLSDDALAEVARTEFARAGWGDAAVFSGESTRQHKRRKGGECGEKAGVEYCFYDEPLRIYEFPLEIGRIWVASAPSDHNLGWSRSVTATGETATAAGTFETVAIQEDRASPGLKRRETNYVAREGLVRREILFGDAIHTTPSEEDLGLVRFAERMELIRLDRP
jgi:hypothetical protein